MDRQPLHIDCEHEEGRHRLALSGELDFASAPALEAGVRRLCRGGAAEVVLDLGALLFIDSAGLNAILRVRALCEEHDCVLAMTPAQSPVHRVFERTRLFDRLPFRTNARELASRAAP